MKDTFFKIFCIILTFNNIFCYYSVKVNKIYLPVVTNNSNSNSTTHNNILTFNQNNKSLDEYTELPLNNSELNAINESFISTNNINFEAYTTSLYIGSNLQDFKLILSTKDDYTTISSVDCSTCKVLNKYNSLLSTTSKNKTLSYLGQNGLYSFVEDSCLIPTQRPIKEILHSNIITLPDLKLKIIESDKTGFLNSDLSDGILGLNYANGTESLNSNFIRELYNKGYISSPSFSLVITSSNINRLFLGDIMKNDYIRNFINENMNKGQCNIVDNENNWKCNFDRLEFNALKYKDWQKHKIDKKMTLAFDIKDNKLTIPESYYTLIVVGYVQKITGSGRKESTRIVHNKKCLKTIDDRIFCTCKNKDDFGVLSFYFESNGAYGGLDIDIRDYVYIYNFTDYNCRVDISLSKKDEFIVGLKGLNNTIISFNMEEKTIKFFHKIKNTSYLFTILEWKKTIWALVIIIIGVGIDYCIKGSRR